MPHPLLSNPALVTESIATAASAADVVVAGHEAADPVVPAGAEINYYSAAALLPAAAAAEQVDVEAEVAAMPLADASSLAVAAMHDVQAVPWPLVPSSEDVEASDAAVLDAVPLAATAVEVLEPSIVGSTSTSAGGGKGGPKQPWSAEEDAKLWQLVKDGGYDDGGSIKWSVISAEMPGRVGKQCRERWCVHAHIPAVHSPLPHCLCHALSPRTRVRVYSIPPRNLSATRRVVIISIVTV